jgi:molybdopterin-binding protein
MRAVLFASATAATLRGFSRSRRLSHGLRSAGLQPPQPAGAAALASSSMGGVGLDPPVGVFHDTSEPQRHLGRLRIRPEETILMISARNVLKGKVVEIKKGAVAAQVRVDIGGGNVVTSMITVDAVDDLGLAQGQEVSVIIKSSEVMLAT